MMINFKLNIGRDCRAENFSNDSILSLFNLMRFTFEFDFHSLVSMAHAKFIETTAAPNKSQLQCIR